MTIRVKEYTELLWYIQLATLWVQEEGGTSRVSKQNCDRLFCVERYHGPQKNVVRTWRIRHEMDCVLAPCLAVSNGPTLTKGFTLLRIRYLIPYMRWTQL